MEWNGSGKHFSLLQYCNSYCRKKFYSAGLWNWKYFREKSPNYSVKLFTCLNLLTTVKLFTIVNSSSVEFGLFILVFAIKTAWIVLPANVRLARKTGCLPKWNSYLSRLGLHSQDLIFLQLINRPNKLECYITLGWKDLPGTNALAYWAHLNVMRKIKFGEYGSWTLAIVINERLG